MKRKTLYKLTDGDRAIFAKARESKNPNWLTNYYLRSENSGTYWRVIPQEKIDRLTLDQSRVAGLHWKDGYDTLVQIWTYLGMPEYFAPDPLNPDDWKILKKEEYERYREGLLRCYRTFQEDTPVFFHPHGIQFLDWQLVMHTSPHPLKVIPGGYGSSKTWGKILSMLVRAITLPGYRAFGLGPYSTQSKEIYRQALRITQGTKYWDRFVMNAISSPNPLLMIGHAEVGENTIECYPILEDSEKLLTLSGDEAVVDQAELIPDLDDKLRHIRSRLRGMYQGRPMVGEIALLANSEDNPILWDLYDQAAEDPHYVWAHTASTFENYHLTVEDLYNFEKDIGRDEQSRRRYLFGERPLGSGKHFNAETLLKCRNEMLDQQMENGLLHKLPGYVRSVLPLVNVYEWELPPKPDRIYAVAADPGWGNPPERNSACILVWDITDFPTTPAFLQAFYWIYGNNSPLPWLVKYQELVVRFQALAANGFDATGQQSGYERLTEISALQPTPVQLSQTRKLTYLNLAKKMAAEGFFQIPNIPHFFSQLARYDVPDEKMRQDIVMALLVSAAILEPYYWYAQQPQQQVENYHIDPDDRYTRWEVRETWYEER